MDPLEFEDDPFSENPQSKKSTSRDAFDNSFASMDSADFEDDFFDDKKQKKKKKSRSKEGSFHSSFSSSVGSSSFDDSFASFESDEFQKKKKSSRIKKPPKDEQSRILELQAKIMELDSDLAGKGKGKR